MDLKIEKELKQAKSLLGRVSWIMSLFGIWPVEKTRFQKIKFKIFVVYVSLHLAMTVNNLVVNFNNIKLVTIIIQQLMGLCMTFNRLLFINYSSNVREIIKTTEEEIASAALKDITEKKIFIKLHRIAKLYFEITIRLMFFSVATNYLIPLRKLISDYGKPYHHIYSENYNTRMVDATIKFSPCTAPLFYLIIYLSTKGYLGKPLVLILPYKGKLFFFDTSSIERSFLLYLYQAPMIFMQPNYCAIINMQVIIVVNLAAQMAILAERIQNLDLKEYSQTSNLVVQKIILRHMELVRLARKIESTWTPIYCLELGILMPMISMVIFNNLTNFNSNPKILNFVLFLYSIVTILSLFGHCLMGELVKNQSEHLLEAFYNCNWCEMPIKYKKNIFICMTYSKITLNITAGKFFVYSFSAFTGMLKSIFAYVSLLREVVN